MTGRRYGSVWDALEDTPEEAANMRLRAELLRQIQALIRELGITQSEAAQRAGITQPRISDAMRGHVDKFTLDALVNILGALGKRIEVNLVDTAAVA